MLKEEKLGWKFARQTRASSDRHRSQIVGI